MDLTPNQQIAQWHGTERLAYAASIDVPKSVFCDCSMGALIHLYCGLHCILGKVPMACTCQSNTINRHCLYFSCVAQQWKERIINTRRTAWLVLCSLKAAIFGHDQWMPGKYAQYWLSTHPLVRPPYIVVIHRWLIKYKTTMRHLNVCFSVEIRKILSDQIQQSPRFAHAQPCYRRSKKTHQQQKHFIDLFFSFSSNSTSQITNSEINYK